MCLQGSGTHVLSQNLLRPFFPHHRYDLNITLNRPLQLLILRIQSRKYPFVKGRPKDQLRQFSSQMIYNIPQQLRNLHHVQLIHPQPLLDLVRTRSNRQQLVSNTNEKLIEIIAGSLRDNLDIGTKGIVGEKGTLVRGLGDSVGQEQNTLVQLLATLPLHLQLPIVRTLRKINHLLQIAHRLVHLRDLLAHLLYLLLEQLPPVQILQHVQPLQVVVDLLLGTQRQLRKLQQNLTGSRVSVTQGSLTNLQGPQKHLLTFGRIVRFELLIGETVVDSNGQGVVRAQVVTQKIQRFLVELHAFVYLLTLAVVLHQNLEGPHRIRMLLRNRFQRYLRIFPCHVPIPHFKIDLCQFSPKIGLGQRPHRLRPLVADHGVQFGQNLQFLNTLIQFVILSLLLVLLADLLYFGSVQVKGLGRPMYLQDMGDIKYSLLRLKERIVDNLEFNTEVIAQGMQNAPSLHLRRVVRYLIVVVPTDLRIDVAAEEELTLLGFHEQQIEEVHETLLELLQQVWSAGPLLQSYLVESLEEVTLARTRYHLSLENLLVEVQVDLRRQRTNVTHVNAVLVQQILYPDTVDQEDSCVVQHLRQTRHVVLLHSLAGVRQLQLPLRISLFTNLAENNVRQGGL